MHNGALVFAVVHAFILIEVFVQLLTSSSGTFINIRSIQTIGNSSHKKLVVELNQMIIRGRM